jgi:hypothetical protein
MLVYHFKQRMATMEQKCDTMVSIINDIAKELTSVKQVTTNYMMTSAMSNGGDLYKFPPPFHHVQVEEEEDPDEDDDNVEDNDTESSSEYGDDDDFDGDVLELVETPIHKIVVSDTEADDEGLKVIHLDEVEEMAPPEDDNIHESMDVTESVHPEEDSKEVYKKMNIQSLRTLVQSKGLVSDASKMKKPEILNLLGV